MSGGNVYARSTAVVWRRALGQVLVKPLGGDLVALPGSGADLWEELDRAGTIGELAERLGRRYDAPPAVLAAGIAPALQQLVEAGVVERRPAP